jgi:hypothetical protein
VKDALGLVQAYANATGSKSPFGYYDDQRDGTIGKYSVGRDISVSKPSGTHSVVYDTNSNKMYFNPWTTSGFGNNYLYSNFSQFKY